MLFAHDTSKAKGADESPLLDVYNTIGQKPLSRFCCEWSSRVSH